MPSLQKIRLKTLKLKLLWRSWAWKTCKMQAFVTGILKGPVESAAVVNETGPHYNGACLGSRRNKWTQSVNIGMEMSIRATATTPAVRLISAPEYPARHRGSTRHANRLRTTGRTPGISGGFHPGVGNSIVTVEDRAVRGWIPLIVRRRLILDMGKRPCNSLSSHSADGSLIKSTPLNWVLFFHRPSFPPSSTH
jgi:hypothetical protein